MAGEEVNDPMIGAPEGENISITHELAIESIRNNLSLHIDEIDTALDMLEDSRVVDNIAELFSDDEDEDEETSENPEDHDEEVLEIDLSDLRDTLIEILTEDMLSESSLSIDEESNILTYQIVPEIVCANDEEEEGETTPEERQEELQDYQDCLRRIEANPVTIQVSANGDQKLNLSITVADQSDALRIQIHDDLIAGFIPLQFVKSFIKVFVDEEDLEMPDTMTGLIGLEARRIDAAHFNLRMAILEDIEINSDESAAVKFQLARAATPGNLTLNGPAKLIEGQLNLGTINFELPWQEIVNILYDDEGETRTECFDNTTDVATCNVILAGDCLNSCDSETEPDCPTRCFEGVEGHIQETLTNFLSCLETVPESDCATEDRACRESRCREDGSFRAVCEYRSWCEEYYEPPEEAPEVEGNLKVFMEAISGGLIFDANEHTVELKEMTLGNDSMRVQVEDAPIIEVNLNPEDNRKVSILITANENGNFSLQVSPLLDMSVALTLENVWEAFVDEREDLPQVLANDVLGIKFDGSDTPTLELINSDDASEMRVALGQLTLSSPNMTDSVVIAEGMCMGSEDEDALSEEERDNRHELFGLLMSVECGAE